MKRLCPAILLLLCACSQDESIRAYGARDDAFALGSVNGQDINASMTVSFPRPWRIAVEGPCNTFSGVQSAPYPWIAVGPLTVTRRICPQLAQETALIAALRRMTVAVVEEFSLTLSNDDGERMVFTRLPDG